MTTTTFTGPVDYLVFTFPPGADIGAGLAAVLERVRDGSVEILDLEIVSRDGEGNAMRRRVAGLQPSTSIDLSIFTGVESEILDTQDLEHIAETLEADHFALAIVYEDRSLAAAAKAWLRAGGQELFTGEVAIADLEDAIRSGEAL